MSATTDFVAAQRVNRRNTLLLLIVLTALAALVGYVIGWLLEGEVSDTVPLWSRAGLFAAALMAVVSVGWSMISLAFGDKMVLTMAERQGDRQGGRAAALQRGRGDGDRRRRADAAGHGARDRRPQCLRHGQQSRPRHHRRDARPAGHAEPRRAAGRGGARDGPSRQSRHALHGDRGRHGRPDRPGLRHAAAHHGVGRIGPQQQQQRQEGLRAADCSSSC